MGRKREVQDGREVMPHDKNIDEYKWINLSYKS